MPTFENTYIRGNPYVVDSAAPTVRLTSMTKEGGTAFVETQSRVGDLAERILDIRDFAAAVDGSTDDTTAIQDAIDDVTDSGGLGYIYLPPGEIKITSQIEIDTSASNLRIIGAGMDRTLLHKYGPDCGFLITAFGGVQLSGFKLLADSPISNSTTHGISCEYSDSITSFMHKFSDLHIQSFTQGCGLRYTNNELSIAERVWVYSCGTGFFQDASSHTSGTAGINNYWLNCRAQSCSGDGWEIKDLTGGMFINCQGIQNTTANAQFWLRGNTFACHLFGLDVESSGATTKGLLMSGSNHTVHGLIGINLAQGIQCAGANCQFGPMRFSGTTAGLLLDSSSSGCQVLRTGTGFGVADSGTGNIVVAGGNQYIAKTAAYTLTILDAGGMVGGDATSAAFNLTLPTASKYSGQVFTCMKTDSSGNAVTVKGTINGATDYALTAQYKYLKVRSNGTNWYIEGAN